MVQNLPADARDRRDGVFYPWVGKIPWRRAWQPTPVFLPGESHGQRSLVSYSPWDRTESDTIEVTWHMPMSMRGYTHENTLKATGKHDIMIKCKKKDLNYP